MLLDEEMFRSDLLPGVQRAVTAIKAMLDGSEVYFDTADGTVPEEWIAHIAVGRERCNCRFIGDEGYVNIVLCDWYDQLGNRQDWYCYWHGISREELLQRLRDEQKARADKATANIEKERERRLRQLHELAQEFGVDPALLP